MRAATRAVLLFQSDHVAGAHGVLLALAVMPATFTHSHTPQRGVGEAALVLRPLEVRIWFPRFVARSEAEVLIDAIRINDFPRIHLPIGIPDGLEFTKRLDQFGPKHFVEKLGFRLTITVLAGN